MFYQGIEFIYFIGSYLRNGATCQKLSITDDVHGDVMVCILTSHDVLQWIVDKDNVLR